jgi:HK97 family phage major capsid protein
MAHNKSSVAAQLAAERRRNIELRQRVAQRRSAQQTSPTYVTKAVPVGSGPYIRTGENAMTSRGFMFTRLFEAIGRNDWANAKVEKAVCNKLASIARERHLPGAMAGCVEVPLGSELLGRSDYDVQDISEFRDLMVKGVAGADPDEIRWMMKKAITGGQSYTDQTTGGAFVGPAVYGELIDLLRNKDAFMRAGASVQALPPTGLTLPRITAPTSGYWLGEKAESTDSTVGTGTMELRPKKIVVTVAMPNELLRYGTVSGEAIVREDVTKTLTLGMDLAFFNGQGGVQPLGLFNTPGVQFLTPGTVAANGDTLAANDIYEMLSQVYQANTEPTAFVLRPDLFLKMLQSRSAVYNGSTTVEKGVYLFDQNRNLGTGIDQSIAGLPAITSNNVPKNRVKGSGSTLTSVVCGNFADYIIAMLGTVEFATTAEGIQLLRQDMTAIRGILTCDGGPRHPGAFSVADNLLTAITA